MYLKFAYHLSIIAPLYTSLWKLWENCCNMKETFQYKFLKATFF